MAESYVLLRDGNSNGNGNGNSNSNSNSNSQNNKTTDMHGSNTDKQKAPFVLSVLFL